MSDDTAQEYRRGLRMTRPPDPEALAAEKRELAALEDQPFLVRARAYWKKLGPGYMQSAMTLGGGTAAASLFAGAAFGYQLLWVAPTAMLLGILMLSAISHQTLSTGMRPFAAMRRFAGAPLAYGWALGALVSSIIWHVPQYTLAASVLEDMSQVAGLPSMQWKTPLQSQGFWGILVMVWAVSFSFLYGSSPRLVRLYEAILKYMVWGIVVCFGLVVVKTGIGDWGGLFRGFLGFQIPGERNGVAGLTVVIGGLAAAVGVNMVFLYPYSQLARGWGREHRRLARFDLFTGMFLPFSLATSLMVIAMANTIHGEGFEGTSLRPVDAARALAPFVGETLGRVVFNLGVLAMALSSITLHMLCAGFVCIELFGWTVGSLRYRIATLLPVVPGVLGPFYWGDIAMWLAVPTSILCGFLLPVAYVGFLRLMRNRDYLQDDTPTGGKGFLWISGMVVSTLVLVVFLVWYTVTRGPAFLDQFTSG